MFLFHLSPSIPLILSLFASSVLCFTLFYFIFLFCSISKSSKNSNKARKQL
ncbi:hypothetical protein MtrunA17_Chr3g0082781 [Medicago truncatula]|uniref:Transmembrane protein n=1 Tax=Medicago truncatula TaxID=3880 RepID=A0A396ILR3_MEDTR|nr:hypothetical protein MtrunA17_Chr3g0082781 [Medicago truncatula]